MLLHILEIHLRYNSWPKSEESAKKASDLMPSGYFEAEVKKSAKNPLKEELKFLKFRREDFRPKTGDKKSSKPSKSYLRLQ